MTQTTTLNRSACPICKNGMAEALQACLALPRRAGKTNPTRVIQNRNPSTPTPDKLMMCNDNIYLKTRNIQGRLDIDIRYMARGRLLRDTGENILGETGGQMPGSVLRVMGVHVRFGSHDGDSALSAAASKTGGKLEVKKLVTDEVFVWSRRTRSNTKNLEGANSLERQLRL